MHQNKQESKAVKTKNEKRNKPMNKLRTQLFLAYFATLSLFLIIVLAVMFFVVQNMMIAQLGTGRMDVLKQIAERANTVKTSSITISNLYCYDTILQSLLKSKDEKAVGNYLDEVKSKYDAVFTDVGISYEVVIFDGDYSYSSQGENYNFDLLRQQLWYRKLKLDLKHDFSNEVQFVRTFNNNFTTNKNEYQFGAGRYLYKYNEESVLLLLIDEMRLNNLYSSAISDGSSIYIFDKDGFIVSHSDKKMLGKQFIAVENMQELYGTDKFNIIKKLGQDYLLSTYYDAQTGWTMVEEIPCNNIFGVLYSAYTVLAITLGGCLLLATAVSYYMSKRVSRPLAQLSEAMDKFNCTDFVQFSEKTGTQEIDHLRESFNHMAGEIIALMTDIRSRSRQKRQLELSFLRAQINPHFLYNTLFSIRCLVEIRKNEQAAEMILAFTDLLKKTLSVESSVITLEEELESTRKYLVLQQIRYGEKINFEFDIAPETQSCYVPPLILQPIVENAVFHGLEAKKASGIIVITSSIENDILIISISDDGVGMSPEKLAQLRIDCEKTPQGKQSSIGLANVHSRLVLNHGTEHGIKIDSTQDIGTTITITLKAQYKAPENEVIVDQ